ncbi:MAG: UvrD-helicase domain-containing protein [Candidatus Gracilibacteria bacterium]|jgi:DNA helicase-2/ATP-dependent DNA helicase PcrA|nr:UvrD-helicase domain-containing protein [Candidatus Gracilibacteria bacterium]
MSEILKGLNERQLMAVTHKEGPLLVLAGAGSGKTKALTHRIAYLIKEEKINPWNILAVTFTNKAANEMKKRIENLLRPTQEQNFINAFEGLFDLGEFEKNPISPSSLPSIGTFHSICVRILRKTIHNLDFENSFAIYDTSDQQVLIKRVMEALKIDNKKLNPKAVLNHISNAKNALVTPSEFERLARDYFSSRVAEIYPVYQAELKKNNALDFDDIIMKTVEVFQKFPDVLEAFREKFKYISVDEYQDTNHAQFILIKLLADKYQNLMVIGDTDQSIYGWRGATIQNILDFEKHFPGAKTVLLEQNYRSTQIILDASNDIIKKNTQRKDKTLWTEKEGGEKIKLVRAVNERHEAEIVAREIRELLKDSEYPDYSNFVALYRTNAQSRVLEETFLKFGIPYKLIGGVKFYERKEIKDIISYLRIIRNPHDSVSLLRIVNTPTRKIGAATLEVLSSFAQNHNISLYTAMKMAKDIPGLKSQKAEQFEKFIALIDKFMIENSKSSASDMVKFVFEESGYHKMLNDGSVEGESRIENIRELVSVASKYSKLEAGVSLDIFLEEVSLIADIDNFDAGDNAVTLMTVHSAKGLEFPVVFLVGLEEGLFPHTNSLLDPMQIEEERRLLYVAITRAMERLYISYTENRTLYGETKTTTPSRFLEDLHEDYIEGEKDIESTISETFSILSSPNINFGLSQNYSERAHSKVQKPIPVEDEVGITDSFEIGDKVSHTIFGKGIVIDVKGGVITVAFSDIKVGVKKLALSIAPLKKL